MSESSDAEMAGPASNESNHERGGRDPVEYITRALLASLARKARENPRRRTNYNFHEPADGYQRMLNVVQPGTYIRPHRHFDPGKSESFVVLRGEIALFTFSDEGRVADLRRIGPERDILAVDLRPGVWHCFIAVEPDTVVFEGKNGPYDPATDKTFAGWAPAEGDAAAPAYLASLVAALNERHEA